MWLGFEVVLLTSQWRDFEVKFVFINHIECLNWIKMQQNV